MLTVDPELFGEAALHPAIKHVFEAMMPYIEHQPARGTRPQSITRHLAPQPLGQGTTITGQIARLTCC